MLHDKFNCGFIDVEIIAAIGKVCLSTEGLINGRHFKSREIKNIFMTDGKLIRHRSQGCLGIAAGTDDINVLTEAGRLIWNSILATASVGTARRKGVTRPRQPPARQDLRCGVPRGLAVNVVAVCIRDEAETLQPSDEMVFDLDLTVLADVGDQKRVMTPQQAIGLGVDYLVIGRPITQAEDPVAVLHSINQSIV